MKTLLLSIIAFTFFAAVPDISTIRKSYSQAADNREITSKLFKELKPITKKDHKTLVAYKGAITAMMARFEDSNKEKKEYFKEGTNWIEYAVKMDPDNIEIRCIRLSIQENSPKILHYRDNIDEDLAYISKNYESTTNQEIKAFVRGYSLQCKSFDANQKKIFQ